MKSWYEATILRPTPRAPHKRSAFIQPTNDGAPQIEVKSNVTAKLVVKTALGTGEPLTTLRAK